MEENIRIEIYLGLICPEYNSIRTQIIRSQNNQLPPDITTFEEIPEESEYYITKNGDNFIIFKNPNLIIFQSPFQAKPFLIYIMKNIFADASKFNNGTVISPINFHCDSEKGISNTSRFELNVIKNKEEKLICIGCNDDDIVELWLQILYIYQQYGFYDKIYAKMGARRLSTKRSEAAKNLSRSPKNERS
ncbi:hypothetical protein U3516DRAFT_745123 [Neocallimastix sp. 'constans']